MPLSNSTKAEIANIVEKTLERNLQNFEPSTCAVEAERISFIAKKVENHEKFIGGNGVPGAKTSMSLMQSDIEKLTIDFKDFKDSVNTNISKLVWLVVGSIITGLINLLIKIY